MIRPVPRHSIQRQQLNYPQYGQFGFEQPVGRKHLRDRSSAIHRLIFNEQPEHITRDSYNQLKMGLKPGQQDVNQDYQKYYLGSSHRYNSTFQEDYLKNKYNQARKIQYQGSNQNYNLTKSRNIQNYSNINSKNYNRMDSLDKAINSSKKQQQNKKQSNLALNRSMNANINPEDSRLNDFDHLSSYKSKNINSLQGYKIAKNPTFLNSLL